jgi:hypothetical protein
MNNPITAIDISNMPDLLDLVAEVETTKIPRELKRDDKVVAVLSPAVQKGQDAPGQTKADYQKSLAAIGSWSDLNPDELMAKIYRWREEGSRQANHP